MATFSPPLRDNASQYGDIYNNPEQRFANSPVNNSGVQNARRETSTRSRTLTSRPSEDGRRRRTTARRYKGRNESLAEDEEISRNNQLVNQRYYNDLNQQQIVQPTFNTGKQKVKTTVLARARGASFGITVASIAFALWPIQILFASMGAILLGMSTQIEESWLAWAADKVVENVGWVIGFTYADLDGLASTMGAVLTLIAGGLLIGSLLVAKIMRLHPLFGNGTLAKTGLFLMAVASCYIPILPVTAFWALAVARYPK